MRLSAGMCDLHTRERAGHFAQSTIGRSNWSIWSRIAPLLCSESIRRNLGSSSPLANTNYELCEYPHIFLINHFVPWLSRRSNSKNRDTRSLSVKFRKIYGIIHSTQIWWFADWCKFFLLEIFHSWQNIFRGPLITAAALLVITH